MNAVAARAGQVGHDEVVGAWQSLGVGGRMPQAVSTLKGPERKSAVYRLEGAGPAGETIVAKRCRTETAATELAVYTQVLPALPVSRLRCFGMTEAGTADASWLFVEDAGDEPFRAAEPEHRQLAAAWMAAVHAAPGPAGLRLLPARRVDSFAATLSRATAVLLVALDNPSLPPVDREAVAAALRGCDTVLGRWGDVADLCAVLPDTLVHGGFGRKNARVGRRDGGLELLVFDWECAGRGMPAIDLARVDPAAYAATSTEHGRALDPKAAWRLTQVGRALWCIASIPGEGDTLASPWAARAIGKIRAYADELADVSSALGWAG